MKSLKIAWSALPAGFRKSAAIARQGLLQVIGEQRGRHSAMPVPEGPRAVLGVLSSTVGLGRGARLFSEAMRSFGAELGEVDCGDELAHTPVVPRGRQSRLADARRIVAHLNPKEHLRVLGTGAHAVPRSCMVAGYWAWETSRVPEDWRRGLGVVDEVWCPSRFVADAVVEGLGASKPVRVVPHPLGGLLHAIPNRKRFGLPASAFVLFFAFDHRSTLGRKNPMGLLDAFEQSGLGSEGVILLVKESAAWVMPDASAALHRRAAAIKGVMILNEELPAAEMSVLRASVDAFVSLHRAEGFGLSIAEAMSAGKPVIATGWSGNLDYMGEQHPGLVDFRLVAAAEGSGTYRTGQWAEPSLEHAAVLMRRCVSDDAWRANLAGVGLARARETLSLEAWQRSLPDWFASDGEVRRPATLAPAAPATTQQSGNRLRAVRGSGRPTGRA